MTELIRTRALARGPGPSCPALQCFPVPAATGVPAPVPCIGSYSGPYPGEAGAGRDFLYIVTSME